MQLSQRLERHDHHFYVPGITWSLLHLLDYSDYWLAPQQDYLTLPLQARTPSTRLRWWQHHSEVAAEQAEELSPWTLEDVYIGGTEINPSQLYEDFEPNRTTASNHYKGLTSDEDQSQSDSSSSPSGGDSVFEFAPNAAVWSNVCSRRSAALAWEEAPGVKRITTQQLIVQQGYMMQFKVNMKDANFKHNN